MFFAVSEFILTLLRAGSGHGMKLEEIVFENERRRDVEIDRQELEIIWKKITNCSFNLPPSTRQFPAHHHFFEPYTKFHVSSQQFPNIYFRGQKTFLEHC